MVGHTSYGRAASIGSSIENWWWGDCMTNVWNRFRELPLAVQVLCWVFLFPIVAPLSITKGNRKPAGRLVVAGAVFVFAGFFWVAVFAGLADTPVSSVTTESDAASNEILEGGDAGDDESSSTGSSQSPSESQPREDAAGSAPAELSDSDDENADGILVSLLLAELEVAPENSIGYDRQLFVHWVTTDGCTTRSHVLIRDSNGTAVTESNCTVTVGQWFSPFDAVWVDVPRSIDIDHFVPLAEAWRSGAYKWDATTRRAFANDLSDPRTLIAVTASSNRSKSDRDPANWLPTNTAYRCDYVGTWVAIKHRWALTIDTREQNAINRVLSDCGELRTSPTVAARPTAAPAPTPAPAPAPSPTPAPAPAPEPVSAPGGLPIVVFPNCAELNKVYPGGVARNGVTGDMRSEVLQPFGKMPVFDDALYEANIRRDGDKDGIACEQR
jgi:hypothetical protein